MTRIDRAAGQVFPLLALLSAGSGCAALIYQVVWLQVLEIVIGASTVSLGVLLATFMGGMCIGSFGAARLIASRHHPLLALAWIELGIGLSGLLVVAGIPAIQSAYSALAPSDAGGIASLVLRAAVAALCLLPPTILMGATLPAIARCWRATADGAARIGILYAANVTGAVAGSLLAGFYLLRFYDVTVATFAAATLNAAVAIGGFVLAVKLRAGASRSPEIPDAPLHAAAPSEYREDPSLPAAAPPRPMWPIYTATALSGLTALSAEVIWTRHLALLLGGTVYTFALVLAGFLLGLALGSGLGAAASRRVSPRLALGVCQLLLCAAIAWASHASLRSLPYWPIDVALPTPPVVALELDLLRVLFAVLPAALLWGASFPLALAAAAKPDVDSAALTGRLYAANTLGAIAGTLATSFVLLTAIGSRQTQQWMIVMSACAALAVLLPSLGTAWRTEPARAGRRTAVLAGVAVPVTLVAIASLLLVPTLPGELVAWGRFLPTRSSGAEIVYVGEGLSASVAVSRQETGALTYHNAGKAQASTYLEDMRLQRMLAHLTTLVPDSGRDYLVIGLGAGITAGAVAIDPRAERVVVADLEPLTREAAGRFFREQNFGVVDNPKVELLIDDGRHYLATTKATFDGITSDPFDPWVKGAAALYTREFWALVRSHLNPGGVVTAFVQLYETTEDAVRSQLATFFETFPNGALFVNTVRGAGYDAVLFAQTDRVPIDIDRIEARLGLPEYARVMESMRETGFYSATDLLGTFAARSDDLATWLEDAVISTDRNLRLQYLAGEGLNLNRADAVLDELLSAAPDLPEGYFAASPERIRELETMIRARRGQF